MKDEQLLELSEKTVSWETADPVPMPHPDDDERECVMARLESAARAGDERAFLNALDGIKWEGRPVADFIRATQLALEAGAHLAARELSAEGAKQYPDNPEIQKYARVLAPPRVISSNLPPDLTLGANRNWLMIHGGEYRGQWIALRHGQLLGVANSLDELVKQVGSTKDVLLTTAY
jgi:hypothetical protein